MKRSDGPQLIAVEHLGHAHSLVLPNESREVTAIRVVPLPGGNAVSLATDVLNALDKRSWSRAASSQKTDPERSAMTWLASAEIRDVFISNAGWLDRSQLSFAERMSTQANVWLLLAEGLATLPECGCPTVIASERDLLRRARGQVTNSGTALTAPWAGFPSVPASGALEFRGACSEVLDQEQMQEVDAALRAGGDLANSVIARGGGEEDLLREIRRLGRTDWLSICLVYGAQLAALSQSWRVGFSRSIWEADRQARPELSRDEIATLRALYDPFMPMMYAITRLGMLTSAEICKLDVDDLSPDGDGVQARRTWIAIPRELSSLARAFHREFGQNRNSAGALFATRSGRRMQPGNVRQRLDSFCNKTALERPNGLVSSQRLTSGAFVTEFRPLIAGEATCQ